MQLSVSQATTAATSPPQLQPVLHSCNHSSIAATFPPQLQSADSLSVSAQMVAQRPDGLAASLGIQPGMQPGYQGPSAGVRPPQPAFRLLPAGVRPPEQAGVQQPAPPSAGQAPDPQLAQVMPLCDATWFHCHGLQAAFDVCPSLCTFKSAVCKFSLALLFGCQSFTEMQRSWTRVKGLSAMLCTSASQHCLQTLTPLHLSNSLSRLLTVPGCVMSAGVGGLQASTTGDGGRQCSWGAGEATGGHQGGRGLALPQWVQS